MRMKFNIFKRAFSLTELLIVLVVVGVLFSAMLPMMTKRNRGDSTANEPVWMYVKDDSQKDAFFDGGSSAQTSMAIVGVDPIYLTANFIPHSKVLLKAKSNQNMIQFRIGNDGNGTLAGLFAIDTKGNIHAGSKLAGNNANNFHTLFSSGTDHAAGQTIAGMNAAAHITKVKELPTGVSAITSVGSNSSMGLNTRNRSNTEIYPVVAIGKNSNMYGFSKDSIFVGANTARNESSMIDSTIAIGTANLGLPSSSGSNNILIGYNVGGVGFSSPQAKNNVIINSLYYGIEPEGNTIVGYRVYEGGFQNAKNVTAIGYNACASFNSGNLPTSSKTETSGGSTTCIGYNSASRTGVNNETRYFGWETDKYDHVFLGGKPNNGFGGRSVLEIHNIPYGATFNGTSQHVGLPKVGPTVVLNSHLVVRGNLYIPSASTGQVQAVGMFQPIYDKTGPEQGKDRCGRRCLGRRKWQTKPKCSILNIILGVLAMAGLAALALWTGGATLVVLGDWLAAAFLVGSWGTWGGFAADALFNGEGYKRGHDPRSFAGISFSYEKNNSSKPLGRCSDVDNDHYFALGARGFCPNVVRSDARLKDNITPNHDAIEKLLQVSPYNFTYKADKNAIPQVGVMAQDLETYFPTAVFTNPSGYKNIRWDEVFFASINSVKSLDESVNGLNSKIIMMEEDVVDVKKDQKAIKKRIKDLNNRITKLENE